MLSFMDIALIASSAFSKYICYNLNCLHKIMAIEIIGISAKNFRSKKNMLGGKTTASSRCLANVLSRSIRRVNSWRFLAKTVVLNIEEV